EPARRQAQTARVELLLFPMLPEDLFCRQIEGDKRVAEAPRVSFAVVALAERSPGPRPAAGVAGALHGGVGLLLLADHGVQRAVPQGHPLPRRAGADFLRDDDLARRPARGRVE